jgi:hypothetical protein
LRRKPWPLPLLLLLVVAPILLLGLCLGHSLVPLLLCHVEQYVIIVIVVVSTATAAAGLNRCCRRVRCSTGHAPPRYSREVTLVGAVVAFQPAVPVNKRGHQSHGK